MGRSRRQGWREWRDSLGRDIGSRRARAIGHLHFQLVDHAILRHLWWNMAEIAPGVWRSNQPDPRRLARYKAMGIRTVLSLRGTPRATHYLFEREACAALGLALVTTELHARKAPRRDAVLRLFALFREVERPFVMHCKSGADRAGLGAALYLLANGATVATARRQLSFRYLHIRSTRTGILDVLLDMYEARLAQGPIGIEDWIATEYTPDALNAAYAAHRGQAAVP